MLQTHRGDGWQLKELGGFLHPAVAGNYGVVAVDQYRVIKAKAFDAVRDLPNLAF
jgi:hypothetical protein